MGELIQVDPDTLGPEAIPEGWYSAIVEACEKDFVPDTQKPSQMAQPGDPLLKWRFRIDDMQAPDDLQGRNVFERTVYAPGRGLQYKRFMHGLGFTDDDLKAGIDPGSLVGLECKILVIERLGPLDETTGKRPTFNNVKEVTRSGE